MRINKSVFEVDMRKEARVAAEGEGRVLKDKRKIFGSMEIFIAAENRGQQ